MRFFKMTLPITLAFVLAVLAITSVFVPHHYSNNFVRESTVWFRVVSGVAMFIGAYSLLKVHYNRIRKQQKGWGYSAVLYLFFALVIFFGILNYGPSRLGQAIAMTDAQAAQRVASADEKDKDTIRVALSKPDGTPFTTADVERKPGSAEPAPGDAQPAEAPPAGPAAASQQENQSVPLFVVVVKKEGIIALTDAKGDPLKGTDKQALYVDLANGQVATHPPYEYLGPFKARNSKTHDGVKWMYDAILWPASSTQYALLGFFICSAAYRTFRAKTFDAAILLIAALIVMLGQVPISALIWDKIPVASAWLLDVPNMAVKRAILFGVCVGSVGTALRVMFGIERSYMGGD